MKLRHDTGEDSFTSDADRFTSFSARHLSCAKALVYRAAIGAEIGRHDDRRELTVFPSYMSRFSECGRPLGALPPSPFSGKCRPGRRSLPTQPSTRSGVATAR